MPVIKQRGAAPKASSTKKKVASKPAARSGASPKRAPKRAAAKRTPARKPAAKRAPKQEVERVNRSPKTDMTQRELNSFLNPLKRSGDRREKLYADWKEAVAETNELILAALEAEVPVNMIVEQASVSRQHIYKLLNQVNGGNKSNGSKPAKRKVGAAAKRPATKRAAKPAAGAKRKIVRRG